MKTACPFRVYLIDPKLGEYLLARFRDEFEAKEYANWCHKRSLAPGFSPLALVIRHRGEIVHSVGIAKHFGGDATW